MEETKEPRKRGRPKKKPQILTTAALKPLIPPEAIPASEPISESVSESVSEVIARCGNCISYGINDRNKFVCSVRGGSRSPVDGVNCVHFKVRNG